MSEFKSNFLILVKRIFNNWQNLRIAVEHGMGGRDGHKTAIQIMEYVYEYCVGNEDITPGELQDVIESLMDQEFNTFCDDFSIQEISRNLLRYKSMALQGQYADIETELNALPNGKDWLRPDVKMQYTPISGEDSSSESDDSSEMECDDKHPTPSTGAPLTRASTQKQSQNFVEPEPGWTTVRRK